MNKKRYIIPSTKENATRFSIPPCTVTASADSGSIVKEDPEELTKERPIPIDDNGAPTSPVEPHGGDRWGSLW
ncbi:MAG: hypothetical protein IJ607_06605 [Bacteroidaceae bacterium]|nr:hypothetical protein [Bacteroidaceae bacterium]